MSNPCIFSVIGLQDAGKTTLIEKMVEHWSERGLQVAVIKHDGHAAKQAFDDWEKSGSDTKRYAIAGASYTLVAGGNRSLLRCNEDSGANDVQQLISRLQDAAQAAHHRLDIIIIEGFKTSALPKIVVLRRTSDVEWFKNADFVNVYAVHCDAALDCLVGDMWRVYHVSDTSRLCQDVLQNC